MERRIIDFDNFQLAFNATARNFCNNPTKELFGLIKRTYLAYLPYMDYRIVSVAVRDFLDLLGYSTGILYWNKMEKGSEMEKMLTPFVDSLAYCMHDRAKKDRYLAISLESDLHGTPFGRGEIKKDKSFPYEFPPMEVPDKPFPMSGTIEDFEQLTFQFVKYAKGRHTYMPSSASEFVVENMDSLSDDTLKEIRTFLDEGINTDDMPVWYCDDNMRGLSEKVSAELREREEKATRKS